MIYIYHEDRLDNSGNVCEGFEVYQSEDLDEIQREAIGSFNHLTASEKKKTYAYIEGFNFNSREDFDDYCDENERPDPEYFVEVRPFEFNKNHNNVLYKVGFNSGVEYVIEDRTDKTAAIVDWDLNETEEAALIEEYQNGMRPGCDVRPIIDIDDFLRSGNDFEVIY